VTVVTAGTPVGLLDTFVWPVTGGAAGGLKSTGPNAEKIRVASIIIAVIAGINTNTNLIYIGVKGMNKGTGAGVILAVPAAAAGQVFSITLTAEGFPGNELAPEDLFLDADTSGNSATVTCIQY